MSKQLQKATHSEHMDLGVQKNQYDEALLEETMAELDKQEIKSTGFNRNHSNANIAHTLFMTPATTVAIGVVPYMAKMTKMISDTFGKDSVLADKYKEFSNEVKCKDGLKNDGKSFSTMDDFHQRDLLERDVSEFKYKHSGDIMGLSKDEINDYKKDAEAFELQSGIKDSNMDKASSNLTKKNVEDAIRLDAAERVMSGDMADLATAKPEDFEKMTAEIRKAGSRLNTKTMSDLSGVDVTDEMRSKAAEPYLSMVKGLKVYNDTAMEVIGEKYKDDPKGKESAEQGLGRLMQQAVGANFENIYRADDAYGILDDKQRRSLDSLEFHGVEVKYSDYKEIRDIQLGVKGTTKEDAFMKDFDFSKDTSKNDSKESEKDVDTKKSNDFLFSVPKFTNVRESKTKDSGLEF